MNRIDFIRDKLLKLHNIEIKEISQEDSNFKIPAELRLKNGYMHDIEDSLFEGLDKYELINAVLVLEDMYNTSKNRYQKVRVALFLSRIYGYYLPNSGKLLSIGTIPYPAVYAMENRQYDSVIEILSGRHKDKSMISEAEMKVLGLAYWRKAFSIIEEQVKVCFTARFPELFDIESLDGYCLKNPYYFNDNAEHVQMPVRIEHTSCVGSDIFYLAMDRPHKARCINISVDLYDNQAKTTKSPISVIIRPVKENGIRLTSVDLGVSKLINGFEDLFNMQNDDLALLKAAVIVSGIVPPAFKEKKHNTSLSQLLNKFMSENNSCEGFEVISRVTDIPRGSGLAVSTNLLAALILALMRFSGQMPNRDSEISDADKMQVVARCIYGEWLGGSGGGWQDCAGLWGGFKLISGQPSDAAFEPDSAGSLLPSYEELQIEDTVAEKILSSLVLVNGGTGQDVGPVLRMITEKYILRDKEAWNARVSTENRFDKIFDSLLKGDIKELGRLEDEDFKDRAKISMLSDNLYHRKVYKRLKELFKDDLWGYDSTGGRAGAGEIFIVNPECREAFDKAFLTVSSEVQEELKGQMHFSSGPLIYKYEINKKGVLIELLEKEQAEILINQWLNEGTQRKTPIGDSIPEIEKIKEKCYFNEALFNDLQKKYIAGQITMKNNISATKDRISQIDLKDPHGNIMRLPEMDSHEYESLFKEGVELLKEPLAYITLNGGESTRFGVCTIRGLNPSFYVSGRYCSMIELKMRHLHFLSEKYKCPVYPVFVNSFFTDEYTMKVLKNNRYYGLNEKDIFHCIHQISHRVIPKVDDLIYDFEVLREKSVTVHEEELHKQYLEAMAAWVKDTGEGSIYAPEGLNKLYTIVSPGHFYSFMSIVSDYTLGFLLERGVKRLIVSSNDNLLSTVDPAILALHIKKGCGTTSEVVPRLYDAGGAPVIIDGRVEILEDFSFPDKETLWKTPFFNPITTWIEIDSLIKLLELTPEDLIDAAHGNEEKRSKCRMAVDRLAEKLNTYVVLKHISEDMGNGITYRYPVIQFEKLYGNLIGLLKPLFLVVPKVLRHTQIKSVDHIYQVTSDRALEVLKPQIIL